MSLTNMTEEEAMPLSPLQPPTPDCEHKELEEDDTLECTFAEQQSTAVLSGTNVRHGSWTLCYQTDNPPIISACPFQG